MPLTTSTIVFAIVLATVFAGGLGVGTTGTSYIFLGCILVLVSFLTITRRDQTPQEPATA